MNQRTDTPPSGQEFQNSEFSPNFIRTLVGLTIATLILVFVFEHSLLHVQFRGPSMYLFPWIYAANQTLQNGLAEFSGKSLGVLPLSERLADLLSLIIGFIVGPTLFFFGWYYRRKEKVAAPADTTLKGSGVIYVIGAILIYTVALPSIPIAFIRASVEQSMRDAQAVQANKDLMINELDKLAITAFEYRVLPHELGGGAGSYSGLSLLANATKTEEGTYTIIVADHSVDLRGTSAKYPSSTIRCVIDNNGQFVPGEWRYGGEFE